MEQRSEGDTIPFARPSVTTGAKLPWQGQEGRPLGPPRAFHSHHYPSTLPTITMSSTQSSGLPKVVCKPDPAAQSQGASETPVRGSETQQPSSPFQQEFAQQQPGSTRSDGMDSTEPSDVAVKLEPRQWNLEQGGGLLGRPYLTQTSLRSTESTLSFYPTFGSFNSGQAATVNEQAFPPSDLTWIDQPQLPSNSVLFSAPVSGAAGYSYPISAGSAGGSLTRCLSDTFLGCPTDDALHNEGRRHGLRPVRSLPKRKYDVDQDWEAPQDYQGNTPHSSGGAVEDEELGGEEQRRQRRRNNNRDSAKRVKERRNADLMEVNNKVEQLQAEQERLVGQCSSMHDSCVGLQRELQALRGRWGENQAENQRLTAELHHLRKNVGMGASGPMPAGNPAPHPSAGPTPGMFPGLGPMQHMSQTAFPSSYGGDQQFALSGGQMAADMGLPWPTTKTENQTYHGQDWRTWG